MPATQESQLHLETAHILFLDVVGYSKLLVNEQREVLEQAWQITQRPRLTLLQGGGGGGQ